VVMCPRPPAEFSGPLATRLIRRIVSSARLWHDSLGRVPESVSPGHRPQAMLLRGYRCIWFPGEMTHGRRLLGGHVNCRPRYALSVFTPVAVLSSGRKKTRNPKTIGSHIRYSLLALHKAKLISPQDASLPTKYRHLNLSQLISCLQVGLFMNSFCSDPYIDLR